MKIPLSNFEQLIDPVILKRGLSYFKKGLVEQEGEGTTGELSFTVQGTELYAITLQVNRDVIEDFTCDCPYTEGPVCKHIAASIFYLTDEELKLNEPEIAPKRTAPKRGRPRAGRLTIPDETLRDELSGKKPDTDQPASAKKTSNAATRKPKKASIKTQIQDIVQQLTSEELSDYLVNAVLSIKSNQADFLAHFAAKNEHESVETYRSQIKAILSAARGRYDYVDYQRAGKVGSGVHAIAYNGLMHVENGNYRSAMLISIAVLEEMNRALEYVDDSNGDVGSNLELAWGVLSTLSKKQLVPELRQALFDFAVSKYNSGEFEGWDWHLGMIGMAANLTRTEEDIMLLIGLLNQPANSEYDLRSRQHLIYTMLLKRKDKQEAQQFLERNISNPELREIALQQAFAGGKFAQVKQMSKAALEDDKATRPGLLSKWYDWLIKTAEAEGDAAAIIEYARLQLLNHGHQKEQYFQLIRKHTPAAEWREAYIKLLNEMAGSRNWQTRELLPEVMVAEQDWQNLLTYLKNESARGNHVFSRLATYGKHLLETHQAEIGELMVQSMLNTALMASKRRDYIELTKDLRLMKKMGYGDLVHKLVSDFTTAYRHRPAMMEEVRKV